MAQVITGNISERFRYWEEKVKNTIVLDWIRHGVPIKWKSTPVTFENHNRHFNARECQFIDLEIQRLLRAKCIVKCAEDDSNQYISSINVVPKKDTFRLVNIDDVINSLNPLDYMVTFDIKNGFFHVPIRETDSKYFCFKWKKFIYKWKVLPFGWNLSPYYFCKVIRSLVGYFREHNFRIVLYVDDFYHRCPRTQH